LDREQELVFLSEIQSVRYLNQHLKKQNIEAVKEVSPFKQTTFQGFEILIGRNSKNNDELVKYGHKNDIWFHAKDVSGSHVLIRTQQKNVPQIVIEHTASLAAYYSKRKTDTICPVMYTELKYVRKRKGFLPGQVITEREKVVIVPPHSISESTQE
jgi:predicted ribosome quality control (RQC) complex YloA/Tae2 family protein